MKGTPRAEPRCPREEISQGLWESQRFQMDQGGSWRSAGSRGILQAPPCHTLALPSGADSPEPLWPGCAGLGDDRVGPVLQDIWPGPTAMPGGPRGRGRSCPHPSPTSP